MAEPRVDRKFFCEVQGCQKHKINESSFSGYKAIDKLQMRLHDHHSQLQDWDDLRFCTFEGCAFSNEFDFPGFPRKFTIRAHMSNEKHPSSTVRFFCKESTCNHQEGKGFLGYLCQQSLDLHIRTEHPKVNASLCFFARTQSANLPRRTSKAGCRERN